MLDKLKNFHDLGFAIHLLRTKSKAPVEPGWSKSPRLSWNELKKKWNNNNVGVVLGSKSNLDKTYLAVIDCDIKSTDPKHEKELNKVLAKLIKERKLPTVLSGRGNGSKHLYFRTKKPVTPISYIKSPEKIKVLMPSVTPSGSDRKALTEKEIKKGLRLRHAWEISIMGEGQQVVLPPSIHPDSSKPYKWQIPLNDINDIPILNISKLYKNRKDSISDKKSVSDFKDVGESIDVHSLPIDPKFKKMIIDGLDVDDRSGALYSVCLHCLHHDVSQGDILNVLTNPDYYLGQAAYDHAKTKDRKVAARWVFNYSLKKALKEFSLDQYFNEEATVTKLSKEDAKKQIEKFESDKMEIGSWRDELQRNMKDGSPKPNHHNIKLILKRTMKNTKILAARNLFNFNDVWFTNTPWGSKKGECVSDDDIIKIKDWLVQKYRVDAGKDKISDVVAAISLENSYHPVREYLDKLEWDGEERLATWLQKYMGAKGDADVLECFGTRTMIGMVKRIYQPGCKFDTVLIFEGLQDMGKSTAARILASDEYFSDSDINIGDKDAVVSMNGNWIIELGELAALSKKDANVLKHFLSRQSDKIRPHYGKRLVEYPRQSIFIGTTNDKEYLKDTTGNRRYWPVKVTEVAFDKLKKDRDQLLAEAKAYYDLGFPCYLDPRGEPELYEKVQSVQKKRMQYDDIQGVIETFLKTKHGDDDVIAMDKDCFTLYEIIEYGLNGVVKFSQADQMRVANSLTNLGYIKERFTPEGKPRGYYWFKPSYRVPNRKEV